MLQYQSERIASDLLLAVAQAAAGSEVDTSKLTQLIRRHLRCPGPRRVPAPAAAHGARESASFEYDSGVAGAAGCVGVDPTLPHAARSTLGYLLNLYSCEADLDAPLQQSHVGQIGEIRLPRPHHGLAQRVPAAELREVPSLGGVKLDDVLYV